MKRMQNVEGKSQRKSGMGAFNPPKALNRRLSIIRVRYMAFRSSNAGYSSYVSASNAVKARNRGVSRIQKINNYSVP